MVQRTVRRPRLVTSSLLSASSFFCLARVSAPPRSLATSPPSPAPMALPLLHRAALTPHSPCRANRGDVPLRPARARPRHRRGRTSICGGDAPPPPPCPNPTSLDAASRSQPFRPARRLLSLVSPILRPALKFMIPHHLISTILFFNLSFSLVFDLVSRLHAHAPARASKTAGQFTRSHAPAQAGAAASSLKLADVDSSRLLEMLIMINMREMNLRRINKNGE